MHAQRGASAFLNQCSSFGALAEQSESGARPERSGAEALSAAGTRSSPAFISARWKNPRLDLRTARKRGATRSK